MSTTNGHRPKRAILYARVSTDEQARSGYSLAQQLEALREYAAHEGYEVLEEVSDPGQSGASLERPGMDRVRDLVATGGVSVVLAQDRDRFAREPAYHYLLKREFEEHGTKIRALNDRGDESPEGELTDGILDQLAKFERAKTAERTRRGKLRKAREGKVLAVRRTKYGFALNATRDGFEVDEEKMQVVRRVFHLVGVEGHTLYKVKTTFEREGLPAPAGGARWDRAFFRHCILDDVYKPHTFEEVKELVSPDVAARLDPNKYYGVWWFNQRRVQVRQVSEPSNNGRRYRTESHTTIKPQEDWVAVPVPDAGIPRLVVDAARAAVKDNRVPSKAGYRYWELSGGTARCVVCGNRMHTRSYLVKGKHRFGYYRCRKYQEHGDGGCTHRKHHRADKLEALVWEFVSGLLQDPERLRRGLEELIAREREGLRGDPAREASAWLEKLADVGRKRARFQDMAAEGYITFDELGAKLEELEEIRRTAERELDELNQRRARLEDLERDKASLLEKFSSVVPERLAELTAEERHQIYRMLRLEVYVSPNGDLDIRGAICEEKFCIPEATPTVTHKTG
jgi:site-specific DNA recombinase